MHLILYRNSKKKSLFTRIINKKNGYVNKYFIINEEVNNDLMPKFGITFIKNMCNAVNRNKLKRQIKSIIDNNKNIITTYSINKNISKNLLKNINIIGNIKLNSYNNYLINEKNNYKKENKKLIKYFLKIIKKINS